MSSDVKDFLEKVFHLVKDNLPERTFLLRVVIGGIVTTFSVRYGYHKYLDFREKGYLREKRVERQKARKAQFVKYAAEFPMLEEYKGEILGLSLVQLRDQLFQGKLSAQKVLRAFMAKTLEVQEEFNCITEFIPYAMKKAKALDDMHMVKGPLHGLPFAVKDDNFVTGLDCTLGLSCNLDLPSTETAVMVQALENLGAIPFCRTNVPQTLVSFGSGNPIFGQTLNPLNSRLSPGGSSSGSACLVSGGGAAFATGSDTGGSLRVPAHFCGISTLKCSSARLSCRGVYKCADTVAGMPGILARNASDLALIMQALTENNLQARMDPRLPPLSWNPQVIESKQKLRIGWFSSISTLPDLLGDTQEVLIKAKMYLESTGHLLIPFDLPLTSEDFKWIVEYPLSPRDQRRLLRELRNDEISPSIQDLYQTVCSAQSGISTLKNFLRRLLSSDFDKPQITPEQLANSVLDKMKELDVDLILCPVIPLSACGVDEMAHCFETTIYTLIWNVLDFPVGVVKVWTESGKNWGNNNGQRDHNGIGKENGKHILNNSNESTSRSKFYEIVAKNHQEFKGMPIGVQIVGKPFNEELVLKTMMELDEINQP